ncbi:MAG TPA: HlyD family efflux transporter periplasmic adaptor subunit [Pirellulales bacterium]|nr:HlyD family efflux transporter periplasmic adaptor subunit [Pirellulales bacterium]
MRISMTRIVLPVVALGMAALGFVHVSAQSKSAPPAVPLDRPAHAPFAGAVAASGVVESRTENISLGAALSGLVLEVYVPSDKAGTRVSAGTPLFRMDDRHLKANLAVAKAQLAQATAKLDQLKQQPRPEELPPKLAKIKSATANAARLKDQFERAKRLIDTAAISKEEMINRQDLWETATHDLAQAQAEYDLLKAGAWKPDIEIQQAQVEQARSQVEQAQTELDRAIVRAPVDGVVLQVNVRPGERVTDMDTRPLMVLGGLETFHVRADIDERDIPQFRPGTKAKAYPRGASNHEIPLHFVRTEPYVVAKKALTGENVELTDTRVLQVIYAIDQDQPNVYVGQQLDVYIDAENKAVAADVVRQH